MFFIDLDTQFNWRYDLAKFVEMRYGVYDVLDSYFLDSLSDLPASGIFNVKEENRHPDLISYFIYNNDVQYWWILMHFNKIIDFNEIRRNINIEYPSIDKLEDVYFTLNARKLTFEETKNKLFTRKPQIKGTEIESPPSRFVDATLDLGYFIAEKDTTALPDSADLGRF